VRAEDLTYLLLNKPKGVVTTLDDPEGRPTILDLLPKDGARLFPVGRLDFYSEGALLCTNDGELAHARVLYQEALGADPGGELEVNWEGRGQPLWLAGPTTWVYEGQIEYEPTKT